jgi:hypothetical protein
MKKEISVTESESEKQLKQVQIDLTLSETDYQSSLP